MTEKLTVTIREFSELAGISKNQAYMLAASDRLGVPVIRLGRRMLLSRRAVLRLLDDGHINNERKESQDSRHNEVPDG
jgi:hypothetical protein